MIKIEKIEIPEILKNNEACWTSVVVNKIESGEEPTDTEKSRYRHPKIKEALIKETHGKCAYCESKLLHVTYGDVEHIHPKSQDARNLFKWSNLTLACDKCNTGKGILRCVVDPYHDEIESSFKFLGPVVVPLPSNTSAIITERSLVLNRMELIERRADKIKYLSDQILLISNTKNPELREVLRNDLIINETASHQEFAATARSFIEAMINNIS